MNKELIDCRCTDCFQHYTGHSKNCTQYLESKVDVCSIYKRLLPLWEYQDRFEEYTKEGSKVHILKVFPTSDNSAYYACGYVDMKNGLEKVVFWSVTGNGMESLIPKSKQWYGVVDSEGELIRACESSYIACTCNKVIKLKEDKGE